MEINRAIIPAAGRGTRLYPETKMVAKEMLLVGYRPMMEHVIGECYASGVRHAAVILAPRKRAALENFLLNESEYSGRMRFTFLEQEEPRGLADAISTASEFAGSAPVFLVLPDNVVALEKNAAGPLDLLRRSFEKDGTEHVGLYEVTADNASRFSRSGNVALEPYGDGFRVTAVRAKEAGEMSLSGGDTALKVFGRALLTRAFFDRIEDVRPAVKEGKELDDIQVWNALLDGGRTIIAVPFKGVLFDCGNRNGLAAANRFFERAY
ncbi:MAG: sugar phosphate nucleotidyltransferase [Planctomycetota bacterium]|jgi:UTP--glucose-1-phosphate uridylyltransferase